LLMLTCSTFFSVAVSFLRLKEQVLIKEFSLVQL